MANNIASSHSLATSASELTPITVKNLCEKIARKLGVDELYLFGSVARNAANRDSDVDFIYQIHNDPNLPSPQSTIEEARKSKNYVYLCQNV